MNKVLSAIRAAVQGEPWSSANLLHITALDQEVVLAGNEIDAAHRLVTLVLQARRDANVFGKDLVAGPVLLAAVERARQHHGAATRRLEKVARDFAAIASDVAKDRRSEQVARRLKALRVRLGELSDVLRAFPSSKSHAPETAALRLPSKASAKRAQNQGSSTRKSRRGI